MPPLIAVTTSLLSEGRERVQLNASYLHAIELAGGVPLLLPPQVSLSTLTAMMAMSDGLVLTGGGDVNPARYGEEPHPAVTGVSDQRDAVEEAALSLALDRGLPVLAICRGMQILNVALGGTLIQDLPSESSGGMLHGPRSTHSVNIAPQSRLAAVMATTVAEVNSRHHQAVNVLGDGVHAVAWSPDGIVEGLEMDGQWVVGVQWHPEDIVEESEPARLLFAGVVEAAGER
jgi:putative glutamine amidotransferase